MSDHRKEKREGKARLVVVVDKDLLESFRATCKRLGLSAPDVIREFLRKSSS